MFGTRFYNETIKRAVSIFGTLFNDIDVADIKADGTILNIRKVPISYGPKAKFLARLNAETNLNDANRTAITLPRIAFELTGFEYDSTRQQNKLIRNNKTTQEADKIVVFDKGEIIEVGQHIELLNKKGIYKELCEKQLIKKL